MNFSFLLRELGKKMYIEKYLRWWWKLCGALVIMHQSNRRAGVVNMSAQWIFGAKLVVSSAVIVGLAACGDKQPVPTDVQTFDSDAAVTSRLSGAAVQVSFSPTTIEVPEEEEVPDGPQAEDAVALNGALSHDTGALTIRIGDSNFIVDDDGPDDAGLIQADGAEAVTATITTDGETAGYDYLAALTLSNTALSPATIYEGVIGIGTRPEDVRTSGSATFDGTLFGTTGDFDAATDVAGMVSITANFAGAGSVDAAFTNITGADFDALTVTGMAIDSTRFSSDTGVVTLAGDAVAADVSTQGQFFGLDATLGGADEVGGTVSIATDAANTRFTFIGD